MVLAFVETSGVLHVALAEKVLEKICQFKECPAPKISEKFPITSKYDGKFTSENGWFQLIGLKLLGLKQFEHQPLMRGTCTKVILSVVVGRV